MCGFKVLFNLRTQRNQRLVLRLQGTRKLVVVARADNLVAQNEVLLLNGAQSLMEVTFQELQKVGQNLLASGATVF